MISENKVMISQDHLEAMRMDASRPERSTASAVVSTAIMVGAAAAVGYIVYVDLKEDSEHRDRMARMTEEHDDLKRRIAALTTDKEG